jgi:hypothetical protein
MGFLNRDEQSPREFVEQNFPDGVVRRIDRHKGVVIAPSQDLCYKIYWDSEAQEQVAREALALEEHMRIVYDTAEADRVQIYEFPFNNRTIHGFAAPYLGQDLQRLTNDKPVLFQQYPWLINQLVTGLLNTFNHNGRWNQDVNPGNITLPVRGQSVSCVAIDWGTHFARNQSMGVSDEEVAATVRTLVNNMPKNMRNVKTLEDIDGINIKLSRALQLLRRNRVIS